MIHDDDVGNSQSSLDAGRQAWLAAKGPQQLTAAGDTRDGVVRGESDGPQLQLVHPVSSSRLLVPTTDGSFYLPCEGMVRLEADGSYTHIHTDKGERLMTCKGIGVLHAQLPIEWFHRCHNTHVINLKKVHKLLRNGGNRVQMLTGDMVQVSRRKWRELQDAMNSLRA
jgi:DNA-binding LytR/AlgR family response regulator